MLFSCFLALCGHLQVMFHVEEGPFSCHEKTDFSPAKTLNPRETFQLTTFPGMNRKSI